MRMEDGEMPKRIMLHKPEGKRGIGRIKARWIYRVNNVLKKVGVNNLRAVAMDREDWQRIIDDARTQTGWVVESLMMKTLRQQFCNPCLKCFLS
jgi:hypothetical protein